MSTLKEVDYFVEELNWHRGLAWYRRQFDDASAESMAVGEASTNYTKYPQYAGVPERIASVIPDARLIYLVRDPIERIRSHHQHRVLVGSERAPLHVAVFEDPSYLDCSRYALQVEQYLRYVPREHILLVTSEALKVSRAPTVRRVYEFIGVDADYVPEGLDREYYKTEERAAYPKAAWWIRRVLKRYLPASKRAKELVDSILPRSIGRLAAPARSLDQPISAVSDVLRRQLADHLRDDVNKLRAYMPADFDGWGID